MEKSLNKSNVFDTSSSIITNKSLCNWVTT